MINTMNDIMKSKINWPVNKQQYNIEDNIVSGRV